MSIKPGTTAYYLDDFSDEVMPMKLEGPTLESWAKWIAEGGDDGPDVEGPFVEDGKILGASTLTFLEDVTVRRRVLTDEERDADEDELEFSPPLPAVFDFAAMRFGPGMGWEADCILDPSNIRDGLCGGFGSDLLEPGDDCVLAIATSKNIRVRYNADPPNLRIVEPN